MSEYEDLTKQLHELADWIEKHNNVHCHSVPRQAAYTISRLEEENKQFRLQLNKNDMDLIDHINQIVGMVRLWWFFTKKKYFTKTKKSK